MGITVTNSWLNKASKTMKALFLALILSLLSGCAVMEEVAAYSLAGAALYYTAKTEAEMESSYYSPDTADARQGETWRLQSSQYEGGTQVCVYRGPTGSTMVREKSSGVCPHNITIN